MLLDVLSKKMKFCDYPMACGDYGVCSKGQCSCPNLNDFRFQNERLPSAGCIPLRSPSCDHVHGNRLILLNNVSYFSNSMFLSFATSTSEDVCKQSCLVDCSWTAVLFRTNSNFSDFLPKINNLSDSSYCLLLSEQMSILFCRGFIKSFFSISQDRRQSVR